MVIPADERAVCGRCAAGLLGTCVRPTPWLENLADEVDAAALAGGSVYGLAAADGVTAVLARLRGATGWRSRLACQSRRSPAAILYDLANGGAKGWGETPPYRELGMAAARGWTRFAPLGTAGAELGPWPGR